MLIFWTLISIAFFFFYVIYISKAGNDKKKIFTFIFLIVLITMIILRPLESPDTLGYKNIFEKIEGLSDYQLFSSVDLNRREYISGTEYGFVYLIRFLLLFSNNYRFIFLVIALLELFFFYLFSKKVSLLYNYDKIDLIFYYLPYFGLMYLLVAIRAGLCLSICLYAFIFSKSKNKKISLKIVISLFMYFVAFTIHRMAIIFIAIELIYYLIPRFNKKIYFILWLLAGGLILLSNTSILSGIQTQLLKLSSDFDLLQGYSTYIEKSFNIGGISIRALFFWALGAIPFISVSNNQFKVMYPYYNIYLFGLVVMNLLSFIDGSFRINDFFFAFLPMLLINNSDELFLINNVEDRCYSKTACRSLIDFIFVFDFFYVALGIIIMMRL